MGLMDELGEGVATIAREVQKAIEQGKGKVEELQIERQMDAAARKLGYLEFDRSRGRAADETVRQDLIQQLVTLEEKLEAAKNARKAAEEAAAAAADEPAEAEATAVSSDATPPVDAPVAVEAAAISDDAPADPPAAAGV